jgi:hypothetical protein
MARVLLLSQADENPTDDSYTRGAYIRLKESAEKGKSSHILVVDPREADLILFAEIHVIFAYNIRHHPYYRQFRDKVFAFSVDDRLIPMVPGVYASLEKSWYKPGRSRAGFYLFTMENPHVEPDAAPVERDLLYSFVGSTKTWPIRTELGKLSHPRSIFIDTSQKSLPILSGGTAEQRNAFWKSYSDIARRSKFVLCPRGLGTSSVRLFEMMKMGRSPVILSDEWVPPEGPKWDEFSIRIPEAEVTNVPAILEKKESEAVAMGLRARQEWERWFAPEVLFDTVVNWCLDIKAARRLPEYFDRMIVYPQIFRPIFFRTYLRFTRVLLSEWIQGKGRRYR